MKLLRGAHRKTVDAPRDLSFFQIFRGAVGVILEEDGDFAFVIPALLV
jgi:hypothetical protein